MRTMRLNTRRHTILRRPSKSSPLVFTTRQCQPTCGARESRSRRDTRPPSWYVGVTMCVTNFSVGASSLNTSTLIIPSSFILFWIIFAGDSPSASHHRQRPGHGIQRQAVPRRGGGSRRRPQDLQTILKRGHLYYVVYETSKCSFSGLYPRMFLECGKSEMWLHPLELSESLKRTWIIDLWRVRKLLLLTYHEECHV